MNTTVVTAEFVTEAIVLPAICTEVDYEAELVVVVVVAKRGERMNTSLTREWEIHFQESPWRTFLLR